MQVNAPVLPLTLRQCLEHRLGFQHEIAGALATPVVFFFALQFTISPAGIAARTVTLM